VASAIACRYGGDPARRPEAGFSLLEMLIATALFVVVTGAVFTLVSPATGAHRARSEAADTQQRLRVAVEAIRRDLVMAGAGTYAGAAVGSLVRVFAPIVPHAVGPLVPGSPDRPDASAITITYVPQSASQARLRSEFRNGTLAAIEPVPGCPLGAANPVCGLEPSMRVGVFEAGGAHDIFTVASVEGGAVQLQHRDGGFATVYGRGASIAEVVSVTYHLNSRERRLYRYDGHRTNLPLVDDVVGLRFEYFGEPTPPVLLKPVTDPVGPWTTYGPRPPPVGTDPAGDDWGPGENCVFRVVAGQHVSRLDDWLAGGQPGTLVSMPLPALGDGPWCPGGATADGLPLGSRYDADLLRVRRVRVSLRVQAGSASLRGADPSWFTHPGSARVADRMVPDQEVQFDVAPRNLNFGR
jgi:prepilin-type N-terminal cleavage/methylation domain-containing protein